MPTKVGRVECIQIFDDSGFARVRDAAGVAETFIVWFNPSNPSAFTRIMLSMWTSLLRDALKNGLDVRVTHDTGNAFIKTLQLNSP